MVTKFYFECKNQNLFLGDFICFPLALCPIHSAILHSQKRNTYVDRLILNNYTKSYYQMLLELEIDTEPC